MAEPDPGFNQGVYNCLNSIAQTLSSQRVREYVRTYDGNSHDFQDWSKSLEKFATTNSIADSATMLNLALRTTTGAISDYIHRYVASAEQDKSWQNLKAELTVRFAAVVGAEHARALLKRLRQCPEESIAVYGERLINLTKDAYPEMARDGLNVDAQVVLEQRLVSDFVDGLYRHDIKRKLIKLKPTTLSRAQELALAEENLNIICPQKTEYPKGYNSDFRRTRSPARSPARFSEYKGPNLRPPRQTSPVFPHNENRSPLNRYDRPPRVTFEEPASWEEPMEVDQLRSQKCSVCFRYGHRAAECRRRRRVNEIETGGTSRRQNEIQNSGGAPRTFGKGQNARGNLSTPRPAQPPQWSRRPENGSNPEVIRRCWHCNSPHHLRYQCDAYKAQTGNRSYSIQAKRLN